METLTLAQLRQNPSAALRAVEVEGAEFQITNHGRPVARLVPLEGTGHSTPARNHAFNHAAAGNPAWAEELAAERDADLGGDPWERA